MTKLIDDANRYAKETQMFQRIAGITESTTDDLVNEFVGLKPNRRSYRLENAQTQRLIAEAYYQILQIVHQG